ncbi:winged helix-turn-helix domain-containing protein [Pontibacter sp. JAM-7]|uniref:winged helix-turn-helix domain-containing protein n=1 Tax=Pontibacter sp. JAM-7 TaxID=3366581 RepID=UPI003AF7261F
MIFRILLSFLLRAFMVVLYCYSPISSAENEAVKSAAVGILHQQSLLIEKFAVERALTEVRLHQAASPLIQAIGIWSDSKTIFPDPEDTPHIFDAVIAHNKSRLEYLRNVEVQPALEAFDIHADRIFYCNKLSFSICLLVSADELASTINVSKAELVASIFTKGSVSALKYNLAILVGVLCVTLLSVYLIGLIFKFFIKRRFNDNSLGREGAPEMESSSPHIIHMGDMEIDSKRMFVRRGQYQANISQRDLRLLVYLAENPDVVITKDQLYNVGWGREFVPNSRSLEQHILTLRNKIDPKRERVVLIETVHGQGYRYPKPL